MENEVRRLIVGISGASGMPIAYAVLKALQQTELEVHLVMTESARSTIPQEMNLCADDFYALADAVHDDRDIGATIASGSYPTMGMLVVPCSMKTVAGIHSGYSDNLLLRAADVVLKERRKLVLCARECPLSSVHLQNLYELSMMGAVILPPMMTFYHQPKSAQDMTAQIVGKLLDQFGISVPEYKRWQGMTDEE